MLYSPYAVRKKFKKIVPNGFVKEKLNKLSQVFELLNYKIVTKALSLSLLAFITTLFEFYYVVSAFEDTALLSIYLVTPLITLSALIPVTFMGLGVREGLSMLLFSMFGITAGTALSAAFLCFVINNISISIIGIIYLSRIELTAAEANIDTEPVSSDPYDKNLCEKRD